MRSNFTFKAAFSLVELSIVLVILGLLVGGVLSGQSLIRAAELRAVTSEYARYTATIQTFRDKYLSLPGDMANAESFWGTLHATDATCRDTVSTTIATCNGDGDGNIELASARAREVFRFWQHLVSATLIEGSYSGTYNGSNNWTFVLGTNVPRSRISNAGWVPVSSSDTGGSYNNAFAPSGSTNWLVFGLDYFSGGVLKPEEAWNIDSKLDDGLPGKGKVTTYNNSQVSNCVSGDVASSATYLLTNSTRGCGLLFGL